MVNFLARLDGVRNRISEPRATVSILDLAGQLPTLLLDAPGMVRSAVGLVSPPESRKSVGLVFQRAAHRHPQRPFLRFEGTTLSYQQANKRVNQYAAVLTDRGVQRGDVVGVLLTNRPEALLLILAIVKLGATAGLLNHNQRAEVLSHSLGLLGAVLTVYGDECAPALDSLAQRPENLLAATELDGLADAAPTADPPVCAEITGREKAFLIFTSGTTGLPKASIMSHHRWSKSCAGLGGLGVRLHGDDTLYCCLPLYHNNAVTVALSSVLNGEATFALGRKFSASRFWAESKREKATAFVYIGEFCRYLLNQPPSAADRDHTVRLAVGNGLRPEIWDEFKNRFAIKRIVEFYGASELNVAFINALTVERSAGMTVLPFAVVEYDEETGKPKRGPNGKLRRVGRGNVGLLVAKVTKSSPFDGYTDDAASEAKLVRDAFSKGDVWFDTGDLVQAQGFAHIAFVDRLGDTFRWKGENVATTQVEGAFSPEPSVDQVAVYGVAVPGTDGKAGMAAVSLKPGAEFPAGEIAARLYERLPVYAVPLFIRVVDSLEQTSTFKSRKVELRNAGYSAAADGNLFVLAGRDEGYVPAYPDYSADVAAGKYPRS